MALKGWMTLTKKRAAVKLENITRAVYYFQRYDGPRYIQEAKSLPDVVEAFKRDPRAKLKIELATSRHRLTLVDQRNLQIGWDVEF
jgi:hypothetical protein